MFFPEQQVRVFLYGAPVDMRRSFDGLYAIARHGRGRRPLRGRHRPLRVRLYRGGEAVALTLLNGFCCATQLSAVVSFKAPQYPATR